MIVLGKKYQFTDLELKEIKNKFPNYIHISYSNQKVEEVIQNISSKIKNSGCKLIILNTKAKLPNELILYLTKLQFENKVEFLTIEDFLEQYLKKCYIPQDHIDLRFLSKIKPYSRIEYVIKRLIDFFISIPLGLITLPIMIYSAYRIKKESPNGPIFYKQKRVGKDGVEFDCIKFRSMIPEAEKDKPQFATKDDPRIFKWGYTMRKTRIDELPQIINVLRGEMHLVGPRPERKYWVEQFEKEIPYYSERHIVAPGITGWAQVNYPYGQNLEDTKQKLMYDLFYVKNWTILLEFKTIFKTIFTVLGKKGI